MVTYCSILDWRLTLCNRLGYWRARLKFSKVAAFCVCAQYVSWVNVLPVLIGLNALRGGAVLGVCAAVAIAARFTDGDVVEWEFAW